MTTAIEATLPRDAAEYLETETDVAEYLAAAFEMGDAGDVTQSLATIARSRGMSEIAKTAGLARCSLHKAIGDGAHRTLSTLLSVMDALNVTLSVRPKSAARAGRQDDR